MGRAFFFRYGIYIQRRRAQAEIPHPRKDGSEQTASSVPTGPAASAAGHGLALVSPLTESGPWGRFIGGVGLKSKQRNGRILLRPELSWRLREGRREGGGGEKEEQIYSNGGLFPKQDIVQMARAQLM